MLATDRKRELCGFFGMLSDPVRVHILMCLEGDTRNVTDLQKMVGMRQQAVTHHLSLLLLRGMVERRRGGKSNLYSLSDRGAEAVALIRRYEAA